MKESPSQILKLHKMAASELKRFTALVENSHDAVVFQDLEGRISVWNRRAEKLYGYTKEEALNMTAEKLIPQGLKAQFSGILAKIRAKELVHPFETKRLTKDGRELQILLSVTGLENDQGVVDMIATTERDLTEYNRALDMLYDQKVGLNQANELLKKADEMKDRFLAMASHDIRSPLSAIRGFASNMLEGIEGPVTPEQTDCLQRITRQCSHILNLLNDLLSVSALESGKLEVMPQVQGIGGLLDEIHATFAPLAEAKQIAFTLEVETPLPELPFDVERMQQVLANLVSNALKFCSSGDTVVLKAKPGEGVLEIEVADTGPGIPQAELPKLFQPFQKLSNKPTQGEKSSGLGMSIVKELVALHQGTIRVESQWGEGTRFILQLPLAARGLTLLWVDDVDDFAEVMQKVLPKHYPQIDTILKAENGQEALDLMAIYPVDLVVTDLMMPVMGGLELLSVIKAHYPQVAVILYTAFSDKMTARDALAKGASAYFTKPFTVQDIKGLLDRVIADLQKTATP